MPEYVYALHDFLPEHEDEVSFHTGERIEVVEKDDLYGDGWWRGRNLAGKVGLFPQSYTTTAPPSVDATSPPATAIPSETGAPLQSLAEEPESTDETSPVSPVPHIYLNGDDTEPPTSPSGEVMQATMTDVQQAIEQLGSRNRGSSTNIDHDARSFSFASTNGMTSDDDEEETDFSEGEGWHKNARARLADKARQALAEAEKLEALSSGLGTSRLPPIDLPMSDESDDEDDDHHHDLEDEEHYTTSPLRDQYIPEEDEPSESEPVDGLGRLRTPEEIPATATATSFPINAPVHTEVPPTPVSAGTPPPPAVPLAPPVQRESSPLRESVVASQSLPSPAPSAGAAAIASKHSSVASSTASGLGAPSKPGSKPGSVHSASLSVVSEGKRRDDSGHASNASATGAPKHPSEWTVEEVVEWLKSKGFDEDVRDKFTEQEITGDVLLDLDVNLLKTEIGIMAFGKRMRIANAIVDLRRPPSPSTSFSLPQNSPQHQQYALAYSTSQSSQPYAHSPHFNGHSRTQSQSHSQQSYNGHNSMQSSVGAPLNGYLAQTYGAAASGLMSPESAPHTGDLLGSPMRENFGLGVPMGEQANGARSKGRPAQLNLSPSDGALNVSAMQTTEAEAHEDERAVMSESELPHAKASLGRRIFGPRSPASSPHSSTAADKEKDKDSVASIHSKDTDASPIETKTEGKAAGKKKEKESNIATGPGRHARGKKSVDVNSPAKGGNERLSIFGASFGGTLGRKPAPRYSSGSEEAGKSSSGFSIPGLKKNGRPTTPGGPNAPPTPQQKSPDTSQSAHPPAPGIVSPASTSNPTLLRKRTSSGQGTDAAKASATAAVTAAGSSGSKLKPGLSVLEQIGETDHAGWMRKKGERYNSWKLRYFVLKGPDMYYLKSSNKAETKIKGHINIVGYKVTVDENVNPGRYGFRIDHDHEKTHYFSSDEKTVVRDWMKAIMKATIGRDYSKPVVSSVNIPTIPLIVAQAMNPAPRPPSPTARAATQRAMRRENTDQPSTRDARVLMLTGFVNAETAPKEERTRLDSFFTTETVPGSNPPGAVPGTPQSAVAPARPARRMSTQQAPTPVDDGLIEWANSHLPSNLRITDPMGPLCDGLGLLRLAESIRGRPSSPPVPDSAFPKDPSDDNLDGLFRLFDFLLDNEVRMGSVSINDIRQAKRDKIIQLLRGLKGWEDKRKAIATSIGKGSAQAGGFIAPAWT